VRSTCTDATQKCHHHCTQNPGLPGHRSTTRSIASDGTCEICQAVYHSRCAHLKYVGADGAQAEYLRVSLADGTLVVAAGQPDLA
jgi:threonine dehydrogenase-like Zn-dependent dehydrogenase